MSSTTTTIPQSGYVSLILAIFAFCGCCIIAIISRRIINSSTVSVNKSFPNDGPNLRLYRRLPTWLKQASAFFATVWIVFGLVFNGNQLSVIEYYSKLIIVISALLCIHCDGLQNLPHDNIRRLWIPVHLLLFLYALFDLLATFHSLLQLLVLVGYSVSTALAGFNAFIVCYDDQRGEPGLEYRTDLRNYLSFSYMNAILFQPALQKGSLEYEDMPPLTDVDSSFVVARQFEEVKRLYPHHTLFQTLFRVVRKEWITQGFFQFVASNSIFISPLALEKILIYIKYQGDPQYLQEGLLPVHIWVAVLLLLIGPCFKSIGDGQNYVRGRHIGIRIKAALICKMYQKSLSVDLSSSKESIGKLNNLISVDVSDIQSFVAYSHYMWSTPYEICISTTLLFLVLGKAALAGMIVMVGTICFGFIMGKRLGDLQDKILSRKDNRMSIMNEVLNSIRILKYYAWELNFIEKIKVSRVLELTSLLLFSLTNTLLYLIWRIAPVLVAIAAFLTYTEYYDHSLTPAIGFTALTLFNLLRNPLGMFPDMINLCVKTKISLDRIESYLSTKDVVGLPIKANKHFSDKKSKHAENGQLHPKGHLALCNVTTAWRNVLEEKEVNKKEKSSAVLDKLSSVYSSILASAKSSKTNSSQRYELVDSSSSHGGKDIELGAMTTHGGSSFSKHEEDVRIVLDNVNITIHPKSLVVIVGSTGSGKSSLLQGTILGEGVIIEGSRVASGHLSYSPQSAWIQNATMRDNILFGQPLDDKRYAAVLHCCSLIPDLKLLPEGDLTEIGEKGVNLSGGQQQRVNLARASYANSDIIILDDPLSAVDAHVGEHIFKNLILSFLKDRTRILVTHNIAILPYADHIICLDGTLNSIAANGTKDEVVEQLTVRLSKAGGQDKCNDESSSLFKSIINILQVRTTAELSTTTAPPSDESLVGLIDGTDQKAAGTGIVSIETKKVGDVPLSVYWYYLRACGGGVATIILVIASLWISYSWLFQNYCLGLWMEDMESNGKNSGTPLHRYMLSVVSVLLAYLFRVLAQLVCGFRASQKLHDQLVLSVLLAPCSWFDATPIGRTINRFSQDISTVDSSLMNSLLDFTDCALGTLQIITVISWFLPSLIIVLFPVLCFAVWIAKQYIVLSRELKRLENIKKSPVFVLFSETLNGLATIRAFRQESRFFQTCCKHVDAMNQCHIYLWIANRWLNFRFEVCGAFVTFIVGSAIVYSVEHHRGTLSASAAGLSLMYSLTFCDTLTWIGRTHAQCQMDLNSVERIEEYSSIEPEKYNITFPDTDALIPYRMLCKSFLNGCKSLQKVDCEHYLQGSKPIQEEVEGLHSWPSVGELVLESITLQYKSSPQPVLRNISFHVFGGHKIGVVGRTGAGKSSLIAALFRIVEPTGKILIDGVNILDLPLHELRKKIAIVPQEPTLFRGSLRFNLDPFQHYSDDEIWIALKNVQMAEYIKTLMNEAPSPDASHSTTSELPIGEPSSPFETIQVAEKGGNFSVGQRQLLCMARAILKKSKVLVLDECTASVDHETDSLIQEIVRSKLGHTTVICIAHRLQTVAYYDKILVMDKGQVAEYAEPYLLMQKDDSIFRSMCVSSGAFEDLFLLAKESFEQKVTK